MAAVDEQSDRSTESDESDGADDLMASVHREVSVFQRGPGLALFGGVVPFRALLALGIFVLVFLAVWMAFWGLAGGLGLVIGWIPAAAVAALVVALVGRRAWSGA